MFPRVGVSEELCCAAEWSGECFDKISSDNKDYLLPQFAYKYNLVSWLCLARLRPRQPGSGEGEAAANTVKMWVSVEVNMTQDQDSTSQLSPMGSTSEDLQNVKQLAQ